MMEIDNGALQRLLRLTTRPQIVAGKPQDQVIATILRFGDDACTTTSLVRDGKTSLSRFAVPATGEGEVPISDIHRLLGVLKFHGSNVRLSFGDGKLLVKSGSKQTTLSANLNGLAFPHSTETIGEWEQKSSLLSQQVDPAGSYTLQSGEKRKAFVCWGVDATDLFEALRCGAGCSARFHRRYSPLRPSRPGEESSYSKAFYCDSRKENPMHRRSAHPLTPKNAR